MAGLGRMQDAKGFVLVPPPIQGIGNSSGFTMEVELKDGSFDYRKLQALTEAIVHDASTQSSLQRLNSSFRAGVPQLQVAVDRSKAETLQVSVGDVFSVLASYLGSTYVNQFNAFGRTFQVYVQADSSYRVRPSDIERLYVRSQGGNRWSQSARSPRCGRRRGRRSSRSIISISRRRWSAVRRLASVRARRWA